MKSPISFKEWLRIVGIVFLVGGGFLLLKQVPFIDSVFNEIGEFFITEG
ncbi:MAG: hypothetical protein Q8930_19080 [Bacillota bacterium]|nr:hypothetical protein [Bacillota bacterium]